MKRAKVENDISIYQHRFQKVIVIRYSTALYSLSTTLR